MAKKNNDESGGNWMDTYGDMVTLLLTFFVMLYSMSSVQEDKWAMLVRAFNIHGDEVVDQIVFGYSSQSERSRFRIPEMRVRWDLSKTVLSIPNWTSFLLIFSSMLKITICRKV